MQNILVGVSLSKQSPALFQYALRLAQRFEAALTIAYILHERVEDLTKPRADRAKAFEAHRLAEEQKIQAFIRQQYGKQYHRIPIHPIVKYGGTYSELCNLAEQESADLMMVGKLTKTGDSFFSDLSDRLISGAPCPLLIVPEGVTYQGINRMVYASNLQLEDCAAILKLRYWMDILSAELICLHVCKTQEEKKVAQQKLDILEQLFPQEDISFRMVVADIEKGIDRYAALTDADMIATTHRNRNLWEGFFKRSITKAIAGDVEVPMLVFQQQNL